MKKLAVFVFSFTLLTVVSVFAQESGLDVLRNKHGLSNSTGQVTPTICALCGVTPPETCALAALSDVLEAGKTKLEGQKVEKVLIFAGDAIGDFLVQKYPDDFQTLRDASDLMVKGANVLPSVTPVCFGTIFTGAGPEVHGIQKYNDKYNEHPLKAATLFDAFAQAGKKVVIISSKNCSIDLIFRGRPINYVTTENSQESVDTARKLLKESDYDLILCYDGNYDSTMHQKGVFAPESLDAMRGTIRYYLELLTVTDEVWADKNRVTVFISDHGAHDLENGRGSHGSDSASDAIVDHFYRIRSAEK